MITRRTKIQLMIFALITVLGVSYVGARYARLDRLLFDDAYTVVAHFSESGGIFAGGEVTYRGVSVGRVEQLVLTDGGVDVKLAIENDYDSIPADTLAVVGNGSAVGEQYVELQPQADTEPFLEDDSEIPTENTRTPIATETLLTDLSNTVESVDKEALSTTVTEMGKAFDGTGEDLGRMIDSGNRFIQAANDNFDITTALIRDSNTVLKGQVASASSIREFARNFALFSGTLAGSDEDLRQVIDSGSATAIELRTFLEDNEVELGQLINNLVTTGEVVVKHLDGIEQVLAIYPYVVEGGFTVVSKSPDDRHVRRPLRPDPHPGAARLHQGLRGHQPAPAAGRQQRADEHERPLHRAGGAEQRPWLAARSARRCGLPRAGRGVVRRRQGRLVRRAGRDLPRARVVDAARGLRRRVLAVAPSTATGTIAG